MADDQELRQENNDLITTNQQIYGRMQMLTVETQKLKGTLNRTKIRAGEQQQSDALSYAHKLKECEDHIKENNGLMAKIAQQAEQIKTMESEAKAGMEKAQQEWDAKRQQMQAEIDSMQQSVTEARQFEKDKDRMQAEITSLREEVKRQEKQRLAEVTEREREKIEATEKLRKEMLFQIKKTKANLLALNDEQLQTTTRLTILQNHQLTTELEYQSKQTEDLLFKNNGMKTQISKLKREIEIHKEVEKELAKRSHFCQKVIKRLRTENSELKEGLVHRPKTLDKGRNQDSIHAHAKTTQNLAPLKSPHGGGAISGLSNADATRQAMQEELKSSEELIAFLESKLDQHEKQLSQKGTEYEHLQAEFLELQDKLTASRQKYKKAALILTDYLEDLLAGQPNLIANAGTDLHLNLDRIKETPFEQLDREDKITLVLVLLKQLQPYFSAQNLAVGGGHMAPAAPSGAYALSSPRNELARGGNQHSSGKNFDEGMTRILNNIHVSAKKQVPHNLPPISPQKPYPVQAHY